jgi:hydroxylysine kinase
MSADDEARRKLEKPRCDAATVVAFVNENWTLPGGAIDLASVYELNSYDDRNFYARTLDGTHAYTLKVHNGVESARPGLLGAQTAMMRHLQENNIPAPVPMRTDASFNFIGSIRERNKRPIHDDVAYLELPLETRDTEADVRRNMPTKPRFRLHAVRVLTWLPGEIAERSSRIAHTPEFLRDVGCFLGGMAAALESFHHPGAERDHLWDNANVCAIRPLLVAIERDAEKLKMAKDVLFDFETVVRPFAGCLRRGVVHGDANDQNVLARVLTPSVADAFFSPGKRPVTPKAVPCGILDFGDIVVSWRVNEIAVSAAYFALGAEDPVGNACEVLTGFETQFPLTETERRVFPTLVQSRLVCSCVCGAFSASRDPANEPYLLLTQAPGWAALAKMREAGDAGFRDRMRASREANLRGAPLGGVVKWIETR